MVFYLLGDIRDSTVTIKESLVSCAFLLSFSGPSGWNQAMLKLAFMVFARFLFSSDQFPSSVQTLVPAQGITTRK